MCLVYEQCDCHTRQAGGGACAWAQARGIEMGVKNLRRFPSQLQTVVNMLGARVASARSLICVVNGRVGSMYHISFVRQFLFVRWCVLSA